jgi:SAM-dependent methyltransferase
MAEGCVGCSSKVLEVGCGTGNYIARVEAATGASCWGVDPSVAMLAVARRHAPHVRFSAGRGERLPYEDAQFDFVFSVDVVHHLTDAAAYFSEAFRVLGAGGRLTTVTDDERTIRACLHAGYFPEMVAVELARYPPRAALRHAMKAAGFGEIRTSTYASTYVVTDAAPYRAKAFSSLQLIPAAAFVRGLERLEADLERGPLRAKMEKIVLSGLRGT